MLTSVHFFTQFITIVVNIYGQTELKRPILLRGNNKKARLGMRGVLEGSAYCKLVNPTQGHCCLPNGDGVVNGHRKDLCSYLMMLSKRCPIIRTSK